MTRQNLVADRKEIGEGTYRQYTGAMALLVKVIASGASLFILLYTAGVFAYFNISFFQTQLNAIFLAGVLVLLFLLFPARKDGQNNRLPWYDAFLILAGLASTLYIAINALALAQAYKITATPLETALGLILLVLILEAVRRTLGWPMVAVGIVFFLYIKFGYIIPGMFGAYPETWQQAVSDIYIATQGIFGPVLSIASSIVVVFIIFGIFFIHAGGGEFFMNLALSIAGSTRGGPAKTATIASAVFGTLSGSPVANVVVTGSITIPMMKRIGYSPEFAGAVECVASTGGNIMPPIMGVVAFIMADMINVPYADITIAAIVPAFLYFLAIFMQIDLRAAKENLKGLPRHELPSFSAELKKGWELLLPPLVLVVLIFILRWPVAMSGVYTILALIVVSMFRKRHRFTVAGFINCLEEGFRSVLSVGVLMALAGVLMATVIVTGLGPRISAGLVTLAGNNLLLLLILTGIGCYVMGMGISILGSYILLAALVAPSLEALGVPLMVAHFFILYMITLGFFTPPLCPVAFVAAPLAGAPPFRIGFNAMKLGIILFFVPFILVYDPTLMLVGRIGEIALSIVTAVIGVLALSVGLEGFLIGKTNWLQRILFLVTGIIMIMPGLLTNAIGLSTISGLMIWHLWGSRRKREQHPIQPNTP